MRELTTDLLERVRLATEPGDDLLEVYIAISIAHLSEPLALAVGSLSTDKRAA